MYESPYFPAAARASVAASAAYLKAFSPVTA
jgi:hypothetical protein